ncbi:phage tail assembly protein T [Sphingomonas aerolata]|uniref:phage tail assembly protein T n=1 Tax=Sphingomonas aerolata TaxID=185951 RepID=UPI0033648BAA
MGLGKTLAELETISHDELVGWQAFYHLEPWGCEPEDHRAELGLNLLYAINSKANATIPRFIDRDPQAHIKPDPTPEELDEKVRDFFLGKTVKATQPEKKPRKARKDKGIKRPGNEKPLPAK